MKKGILVDFQADGVEVHIFGNGNDVLKAMELVLNSLDESCGSTALSDDMLERLILKRTQAKEQSKKTEYVIDNMIGDVKDKKVSGLMGLLLMMEALGTMKSGEQNSSDEIYFGMDVGDKNCHTGDQLRDELYAGKLLGKQLSADFCNLLKKLEEARRQSKP